MHRCAAALFACLSLLLGGQASDAQTSPSVYIISSVTPANIVSGSGDTVLTMSGTLVNRPGQTYNICFYNAVASAAIVPTSFVQSSTTTFTFTVPGARFQTGTAAANVAVYLTQGAGSTACNGTNPNISNTYTYNIAASNYALRTASPSTLPSGSNTTTVTLSGAFPTFPANGSGLGLCFYAGANNTPLLPTNQSGTSSVAFSVPAATFANAATARIYLATANATCTGSNIAYSNALSFAIPQAMRFTVNGYTPQPIPAGSGDTVISLSGSLSGTTIPNNGVCFYTGTGSSTTPIAPSTFTSSQIVFTAPAASFQIPNASFPSGSFTAYAYLAAYGTQCTGPTQNQGISNTQSITIQYPSIVTSTLAVIPQINPALAYTPLPSNFEIYGLNLTPALSGLYNFSGGVTSIPQAVTLVNANHAVIPIPTLNASTQPLASTSACNNGGSFKYCSPGFALTAYPLASTSTAIASSAPSPAPSQAVTLTATVTPGAGSSTAGGTFIPGPPTGTVAFSDGQTALGSSPLVAGALKFSPASTQQIQIYAGSDAIGVPVQDNAAPSAPVRPNETPSPNVNSQFSSLVADFNKDGINDTLVIQSSTGVLHLFLGGSPLGTLQAEQTIFPGNTYCSSLSGVTVADLNGDGFPDIAFLCGDSGGGSTLQMVLNAGDGTFSRFSSTYNYVIANQLAAADINGDGKVDLVLTGNTGTFCCTGQTFAIQTFLGDGTGNFTAGPSTTTTDLPGTQIVLKDLNNDRFADLALLHYDATAGKTDVALFQNDGTGRFTKLTSLPVCNCQTTNTKLFVTPLGASTTYPGIIVAYQEGSSILAFTNKGTQAIGFNTVAPALDSNLTDVVLGDFTGDGLVDVAHYDGSNISIEVGNGAGLFALSNSLFAPYFTGTGAANLVSLATAPDLNGDGYADLIAIFPTADTNSSTIVSYVTTGTALASVPTQFTSAGAHAIATAYRGNLNVLGSNGAQTVNVASPTVAPTLLTFAPPSATPSTTASQAYTPGGTFSLNFQVNKAASDTRTPPAPSGTVSISDNTGVLARATLSALNGTSSSASVGSFGSATIGTHTYTITYSGDSSFSPTSQVFTFTVTKAAPVITWNPATATNTTTPLGTSILNATANVPGAFAYTPAAGSYLPASASFQNITAVFTPTDTTTYSAVTTTRNVTVSKTTPVITTTINPASPITYSPTQIIAYTARVTGQNIVPTGMVQFNPLQGVSRIDLTSSGLASANAIYNFASSAGTLQFSAVYLGDAVYNGVTSTVTNYVVTQSTPTVTYSPTPTSIPYGTGLVASQLNATAVDPSTGATIPGTFTYLTGNLTNLQPGTVLPAGSNNVTAAFTPSNTTNYASLGKSAIINVTAGSTTTSVSVNPSSIAFGASTILSANVSPAASGSPAPTGQVTFTDSNGTIPNSQVTLSNGTASLTYTPTAGGTHNISAAYVGSSSYNASSTTTPATLVVTQKTPNLAYTPNPSTTSFGTPVVASQLNATALDPATGAAVPGTFAYSTPTIPAIQPGTILPTGPNVVTARFTPTDTTTYATASQAATITITPASTTTTVSANPGSISLRQSTTLTATVVPTPSSSPVTGQITFADDNGTIPSPQAVVTNGVATLSYTPTTSGTHRITAAYGGATNYASSTSAAPAAVVVNQKTPVINYTPIPGSITYGTGLVASQLNATAVDQSTGANVPGTFAYSTPTIPSVQPGTILPAGFINVTARFTPTDTTTYSTATQSNTITVTKATPTLTYAPTPTSITYGTGLAASQLNATAVDPNTGATLPGTVTYSIPTISNLQTGSILPVGTNVVTAAFAPTDATNYASVSRTANIAVTALPTTTTLTVNPTIINLGQSSILTAKITSSVPGTITGQVTFSSDDGTIPNNIVTVSNGTANLSYTPAANPANANRRIYASYSGGSGYAPSGVSQPTILTVGPKTPIITYAPTPTSIAYGTPLIATQLNATVVDPVTGAAVPGVIAYATPTIPAIQGGMVLPAGANRITATFTPTDMVTYITVSQVATVTVTPYTPNIVWATPVPISYGTALSSTQLNAVANDINGTAIPGAFSYSPGAGTIQNAGNLPVTVNFSPTDSTNFVHAQATRTITITPGITTTSINLNPATIVFGQTTYIDVSVVPTIGPNMVNGTATVTDDRGTVTPAQFNVNNGVASALYKPITAGIHTITVSYGGYQGAGNYAPSSATAPLTVTQGTPVITFSPSPATITYGTPLSAAQLDATTTVAGVFAYSPALNTILDAGVNTITATFTPTDTDTYTTVTKTATVTVTKFTPNITWATPASIPYGTPLSSTQLNAVANDVNGIPVPGTYIYNPAAGTVPTVGNTPTTVNFTPTNTTNFATANALRLIAVTAGTTTSSINLNPATIVLGQSTTIGVSVTPALGSNMVSGQVTVTDNRGTITPAQVSLTNGVASITYTPTTVGVHTITVNYPGNGNYAASTATAPLTVTQGSPVITFAPNPATIPYGTPLSAAQLNAVETTGTILGTFSYSSPLGTVLNAGANTITATFTPTDTTSYSTITKTATVTVTQFTPAIVWATPASIPFGTALSSTQLNAVANDLNGTAVPGIYSYNPVAGAVLPLGTTQEALTFTPASTQNFATATATRAITVTSATTTTTLTITPATITAGQLTRIAATVTPTVGTAVVTGQVTFTDSRGSIAPGTVALSNGVASFDYAPTANGTHTITATFTGSTTYATSTAIGTLAVGQGLPAITFAPNPATIIYGTPLSAAQLNAVQTTTIPGTFSYSSPVGTILPVGANIITATFTPADTASYAIVTKTATVTVTQAIPTLAWNPPATTTTNTPLDATILSATASVPGAFAYTPAAGSYLAAGSQTLNLLFTPSDSTNYQTASATRTIAVSKVASTPITLVASPASQTAPNLPTIFTASIPGSNLTPTGVIQLFEGSALLGTGSITQAVGHNGVASITVSTLASGVHTILASFAGDTVYNGATSNTLAYSVGGATVPITFIPNPATISYGTPLSAAQLNATSSVPGVFTYSPALNTVLNAGLSTITATFTPTDTVAYRTATQTASVTVTPFTPTIAWAIPASIPFGTPLSPAQLNAVAKDLNGIVVPGTYAYSPAAPAVLPLGVTQDSVTFTPTNTQNFNIATASVPITVVSTGTTTSLTLSTGSLDLGQPVTLTAAVSPTIGTGPVTGQVAFTDNHGTITPAQVALANGVATLNYIPTVAGTHLLSASFLGSSTYNASSTLTPAPLAVGQQLPVITFAPSPSTIVYGTPLSGAQLNAVQTTSIPGAFSYAPSLGAILPVGANTVTATFTPTDTVNYGTVARTAVVTVTQATPLITFIPSPTTIPYGTPLSAAQLNAVQTTAFPGAFSFSPGLSTILPVGANTITATFIPADTLNIATVTRTAIVTVTRAMPVITWLPAASTTTTTPVDATLLNATSSVAGTFRYTPALGTFLPAGNQTLTAVFTPTDATNYNAVTTTAATNVAKSITTLLLNANPSNLSSPGTPTALSVTLAGLNIAPTGSVEFLDGATSLGTVVVTPASANSALASLSTTLASGNHGLIARYIGDAVYNAANSNTIPYTVGGSSVPITFAPSPATIPYGTPLSAAQLDATSTVPGTFTYFPTLGTILDAGTYPITATFTPTDTVSYQPATQTATVTVTPVTPTIAWTPNPSTIPAGTPLSAAQLNATSFVPGTFIYSSPLNSVLPIGPNTLTATFTPTSATNYTTATQNAIITVVSTLSATTLTLNANGETATSIQSGTVLTLTASVTTATSPVRGQVNFCDTIAALCSGTSFVGSAQLTDAGTATLRLIPAIGVHSYKAVYIGTNANVASASTPSPLLVSGTYPTVTTFTSTGATGNFTLTAVVTGTGSPASSPTGTVQFLDTSNANAPLATGTLGSPTLTQSFTTQTNTASGVTGSVVLTADFNNDGIFDLVTGTRVNPQSSDGVQVFNILLGSGDGTFATKSALPSQGTQVVTGDFNHDGILDLAVANYNNTNLFLLFGGGDGTFTLHSTATIPAGFGNLLVGDFNHDGVLDLVAGSDISSPSGTSTTGALTALLGAGDGTFATVRSTTAVPASGIVANDFNGDGIPDLLATGSARSSSTTSILLGNGDGTFTRKSTLPAHFGDIFASADLNNDGIADLASVNFYDSSVTTYLGKGDGTFNLKAVLQNSTTNQSQYDSFSLAFTDINHDGISDIATVADNGVFVYNGVGDGTFNLTYQAVPQTDAGEDAGLAIADFNNDGQPDLATTANIFADGTAHVVLALNTLTSAATATATNVSPYGGGSHLVTANYRGDPNFAPSTSTPTNLGGLTFTPTLTWTPAPLSLGSPLSAAQLNATARGVDGNLLTGTFTYTPAAGTILPVGRQPLSVTFTPTDLTDYTVATLATTVQVNPLATSTTLSSTLNPSAFGQPITLTATITPTVAFTTPVTGPVTFFDGTSMLGTTQAVAGVASLPVSTLSVGNHLLTAAYAGDTAGNFVRSTSSVLTQVVSTTTPLITWTPNPATIPYGTRLSAAQLNAIARTATGTIIPGIFTYTPALNALVPAPGTTLSATFTPTDTTRYAAATATAVLTVTRATPAITWPTPAPINQGTPLSATQLNATATGIDGLPLPGVFTYTPASGVILSAGTQTLSVSFTPTDAVDYLTTTATVALAVLNPTTTTILTTSLTPAQFGQPITLTATIASLTRTTAPLSGNVTFFDGPTQIGLPTPIALTSTGANATLPVATLGTGTHQLTAIYANDPSYVTSTSLPLTQTILIAPTTLVWTPTVATIPYGTPLSAAQLNATATSPYVNTISGLLAYSPAAGTILSAGPQTLTATFSPTDTANFLPAAASTLITVTQATPTIAWPTPAPITQGAALSATQLNATASVSGTFTYTPAAGTVLQAGTTTLRVLFTPTDAVNYTTATASVPLVITIPATNTTLASSLNPSQSGQSVTFTATVTQTGSSAQPLTGTVTFTDGVALLGTSPLSGSSATLTTSLLSVTTHTVRATYNGSPDFAASASAPLIQTITSASTRIVWTPSPATIVYGTPLSAAQLNATATSAVSATVPGIFTYTPAAGTVLPAGAQTLAVTFTPTDTINATSASTSVSITVTRATPTLVWPTPSAVPVGTILSATQLNATVTGITGDTLPGAFAYTPPAGTLVTSGAQTLTVLFTSTDAANYTTANANVTLNGSPVTLTALSSSTASLGDPAKTITLTGTGFVSNSVARANGSPIATTYVNPSTLTAILPANNFLTVRTLQITVNDPTQNQTTSALPFTVVAPTVAIRVNAPTTANPGDQPSIQSGLTTAYPVDVTGIFTLAFTPFGNGTLDPAIQFSTGGNTTTFTIPAGQTTIPTIQLQSGTVAGTIRITLTLSAGGTDVTPAGLAPLVINVPTVVPGVTSVTLVRNGRQLSVRSFGFSNTREVTQARFHFSPATGQQIDTPDVTVDVGSIFARWYSQSASTAYGSTFLYTQTFTLDDDASVVGQVTVTLSNGVGVSALGSSQP